MMASSLNTFNSTFESIKSKHEEVFCLLNLAVQNEENEDNILAFQNYKKGISKIDEALEIPVRLPEDTESVKNEWNEACKMIHQLKRARAEVLQRIGILGEKLNISSTVQIDNSEVNDAGTDNLDENKFGRPWTYTELAQELRRMQCNNNNEFLLSSLELVFSCKGITLYHIKPDGSVTSLMQNAIMRIVRIDENKNKGLRATFFIQTIKSSCAVNIENLQSSTEFNNYPTCSSNTEEENHLNYRSVDNFDAQNGSSWIYPLIPKVSPCFRTDFGAFLFPDLESTELGSSFGIIVPKDDNNDEIVLELLESILYGVVIQSEDGGKLRYQKVSENIVRGAHFISLNLVKGAEKTGNFISNTTPFIMSKIKGASNEETPHISNKVQTTVNVTKNVTGAAVSATGYIAEKIGSATMSLGRFLAPHIQKHGSTLLSKSLGLSKQEAEEKVNGVLTIAAGAVEGFGTVYSGLEESARILGKNLGENSTKIIEHKYGPAAGTVAAGTFDTVGNVINLSQNISYFTPKGFVKKTAKNAGKAIVQSYRPNNITSEGTSVTLPARSVLYPNLSLLKAETENLGI